ncbi:hypothetical protein [Aureimonas fodinaquatilis]|nr:hypothetical protein [Aureimonas fodinaquatilis]
MIRSKTITIILAVLMIVAMGAWMLQGVAVDDDIVNTEINGTPD